MSKINDSNSSIIDSGIKIWNVFGSMTNPDDPAFDSSIKIYISRINSNRSTGFIKSPVTDDTGSNVAFLC